MPIVFAGRRIVKPGAYSQVDASNMVPISTGTAKVLAFVGEATSGDPKAVKYFNDPQQAKAYLRGGSLLKAMQLAWAPSTERNGADLIACVPINASTQAKHVLKTATDADAIELVARAYGVIAHQVKLENVAGKLVITLTDGTTSEVSPALDANNDAVVAWVNTNSTLCTATKKGEVVAAPVTTLTTFTTPGTCPEATSTDWEDGLDALATKFVDGIVVVTDDSTVHDKLKLHVLLYSGKNKERRGFVGHALAETEEQILTRASNLGSDRMVLCTPGIKSAISGTVETLSSTYLAAIVAGIWAGNDPAEPLTYDYINVLGLETEYTDFDNLLLGGVLAAEATRNGYRIVHALTTYLASENTLYKELSCSTLADDMSKELREYLEAKIVGRGGSGDTVPSIYNAVETKCKQFERRNWLVGTETVPAYRNIQVYKQGTGYIVEWEGSMSEPNNYVLITSHFSSAQ